VGKPVQRCVPAATDSMRQFEMGAAINSLLRIDGDGVCPPVREPVGKWPIRISHAHYAGGPARSGGAQVSHLPSLAFGWRAVRLPPHSSALPTGCKPALPAGAKQEVAGRGPEVRAPSEGASAA